MHMRGEIASAASSYREAQRLLPTMPEAWSNHGKLLIDTQRLTEAIEVYQQGIEICEARAPPCEHAELYHGLGAAYYRSKAYDQAAACVALKAVPPTHFSISYPPTWPRHSHLLRSAELAPASAEISNAAGLALHYAKRDADALPLYEAAAALEPTFAEASYNLAVSLEALGRVQDAGAAYRAAIAVDDEYGEAWLNLAALHHKSVRALDEPLPS